jgi:hypothetical protein
MIKHYLILTIFLFFISFFNPFIIVMIGTYTKYFTRDEGMIPLIIFFVNIVLIPVCLFLSLLIGLKYKFSINRNILIYQGVSLILSFYFGWIRYGPAGKEYFIINFISTILISLLIMKVQRIIILRKKKETI